MDKDDGFDLCFKGLEKIKEVQDIGEYLNDVQRWFEAEGETSSATLKTIHEVASTSGILCARLAELQIRLLKNL